MTDSHRHAIRAFMERRNININDWCSRSGIAPSTLYNYLNENDKKARSLSGATLRKLAEAENTTVGDILGEDDVKNPLPISWAPVIESRLLLQLINKFDSAELESRSVGYVPIPSAIRTVGAVQIPDTSVNRQMGADGYVCFNWKSTNLRDGKLYLVQYEGSLTIRRFFEASPKRLEPDSSDQHQTIFLGQARPIVIGEVVYLARKPS